MENHKLFMIHYVVKRYYNLLTGFFLPLIYFIKWLWYLYLPLPLPHQPSPVLFITQGPPEVFPAICLARMTTTTRSLMRTTMKKSTIKSSRRCLTLMILSRKLLYSVSMRTETSQRGWTPVKSRERRTLPAPAAATTLRRIRNIQGRGRKFQEKLSTTERITEKHATLTAMDVARKHQLQLWVQTSQPHHM